MTVPFLLVNISFYGKFPREAYRILRMLFWQNITEPYVTNLQKDLFFFNLTKTSLV
jgi:hypothetical protein